MRRVSFLCVALVSVFKSAMAGTCAGREELAAPPIALDPQFADWGDGSHLWIGEPTSRISCAAGAGGSRAIRTAS